MARQNIPTTPTIRTVQYDNLLGVDFQNDATEISRYRSPDMFNMISDLGGNPVKRFGYRRVGDAYLGFATVNGETYAVRNHIQDYSLDIAKISVDSVGTISEVSVSNIAATNSAFRGEVKHVVGFQSCIYIMCEKAWFEYNVETSIARALGVARGIMWNKTSNKVVLDMPDSKFIPTVYTMYKPNGKEMITLPEGTDITGATQGVNILTPFRRAEYCVTVETATEVKFVIPNASKISPILSVEVLDSSTYEWKATTAFTTTEAADIAAVYPDGVGYETTEYIDAYITFTSAPYTTRTDEQSVNHLVFADATSVDVPSGVPNVRITYALFDFTGSGTAVTRDETPSAITYTTDGGTNPMTVTLSSVPILNFDISYRMEPIGSGLASVRFKGGVAERKRLYGSTNSFADYDGDKTITFSSELSTNFYMREVRGRKKIDSHTLQESPSPNTPMSVEFTTFSPSGTTDTRAMTITAGSPYSYGYESYTLSYDGNKTFTLGEYATLNRVRYLSAESEVYKGYYRPERVALFDTNEVVVYDARLFAARGVHTYYSRSSQPLNIDDNYYFDVDNKIKLYAKTSSALAIIAEDTGKDVIYLAQGEYDSNLAMQVYSVKASNAGVGAISSKVSGVLNDEPIFLSRTGLYGITTNYYSEKYSIARSGKINRRMCAEPNLENAVGASYSGYFYLAVNGHMYVLDSRHKDQSRNGDNSYEGYYFEDMPNITDIFVINNRMFFSDGTNTYTWNDNLSGSEYYDIADGVTKKPVKCRWTSMLDNDGIPNYYKVLNKKGTFVTLSPPMQTSCEVTIIKDAHDRIYVGRFDGSTFALSDSVLDGFTKKKIKKYKRLQFVVENNEAEPFGILSIVKSFTVGNLAKR